MPPRRTRKKYGREIPQVSQTRDSFNGRQIRKICEKGFSIADMDSFSFWGWASYNSPRNHMVKPWKEGDSPLLWQSKLKLPFRMAWRMHFFGECCGKTNHRRTQLPTFFGVKKLFQMRSILKNPPLVGACRMSTTLKTHSLGKKNLWVWKRRILLKQLYGHQRRLPWFFGEPSTWWIPKISDMEPLEIPIIQLPTCFFYQQLRESNIKYFT